jgi:hypothetical protein
MDNLVLSQIATPEGTLLNVTVDAARAAGATETAIEAAVNAVTAAKQREALRARINAQAGDIPSLLGTTADVAALGLIGIMQLLIILSEEGSANVKAAIAAAPIPLPIDKAKTLVAAIANGSVKVPALIKGIDAVYAEVAARSTATALALGQPVSEPS